MSLSSLQALADNHKALLLAEVAALLHDMGKCCDLHIQHVSGGKRWSNDDGYKAVVDNPSALILLSQQAANIRKPEIINHLLNIQSPKAADFIPSLLKDALIERRITVLGDQDYALAELIMLGMPGFATHQHRDQLLDGKDGWLPALLGVCHNEAHVDKEETVGGQQILPNVLTSNAFGFEQQVFILGDAQKSLDAHLKILSIDATSLTTRSAREKIIKTFENALGDTRRPINEVTLADWSEIVAALFKSALAGAIVRNNKPGIRQWKSWEDKIIDHDLRWRILRVNFDVLSLYAKAIKIADLLAYQKAVGEACRQVKDLVEEEYPLGNEIYRDTSGIYFTFPDLDLPVDLAQEIRRRVEEVEPELAPRIAVEKPQGNTAAEQLKRLLADARKEARQELAQPFDMQNLNPCWQQLWDTVGDGNWELCPVCRLRPKEESQEACRTCERRRGSRIADWEKNPAQTIWMDELADHNDRVALLVGKFGLDDWLSGDLVQTMLVRADPQKNKFTPKNPSPARLRRVWETCQRFWTETVEQQILAQYSYGKGTKNAELRCVRWLVIPDKKNGWQENVPYDGTVNGKPISLLWRDNAKYFVTIINLQLTGELKHGQKITVSDPDEPRKKITFEVQGVIKEMDRMGSYTPFLSLLSSPDQFLALVPAADALDVAAKIRGEYVTQFGKVQNRLPLFLGIVFFHRKMPLAAVMDAARRMLAVPVSGEQWTVECSFSSQDKQMHHLRLSKDGQRICWDVQVKMGDGTTDDLWYPYYQVEHFADGTPNNRSYRFQHDGRWFVHVNELKESDVVFVIPSRFAYLWLEHTARRFAFDVQRDVMLLDELPRLMEMWEKLCQTPEMTDTKLRGVQALLEAKGAEWGGTSDEFQNLARTTLGRTKMRDAVALEDVTGGRFARCLELYTKILKRKVKED